jgi:hypothetical protein
LGSAPLPPHVRVHLNDRETLEFERAQLEGDSILLGWVGSSGEVLRVPVEDIEYCEGRYSNPAGTVTLLLATPVVAIFVLVYANRHAVYTLQPGL